MNAPERVDIVQVDVRQPVPQLPGAGSTMVVLRDEGAPVGLVDVDLADRTAAEVRIAAAIAALPPRAAVPRLRDECLPGVSVIVPTIVGRPAELVGLLDSLDALDYPDYEIVLVDNRTAIVEPDVLGAIVAGRSRVRVVRQQAPGVAAARNAGVAAARHELLAFADDDVRVEPEWLRAVVGRFVADPLVDVVTGIILPAELETPAQIWFERYYGGFAGQRVFAPLLLERDDRGARVLRPGRVVVRDADGRSLRTFAVYGIGAYGAGANMAFRRSALIRVGGFDAALSAGEDLAAYIRILVNGGRLAYEPRAVVHHRHRRDLPGLLRQLRWYGAGFVATLISLVLRDPRHLVWIAAKVPQAAASIAGIVAQRIRGRGRAGVGSTAEHDTGRVPPSLAMHEYGTFVLGPIAYLRGRSALRRHPEAALNGQLRVPEPVRS